MPYSSDAQRRWAHTSKGEKALGGPEGVNEWDQASKGKKLPEHAPKMADGGIVGEIKDYLTNLYSKAKDVGPLGAPDSTLEGLAKVMADKNQASQADAIDPVVVSSDTPKMADGGLVVNGVSESEFEDPVPGPEMGLDTYPDKTGYRHITEYDTAADGGVVDDGSVDLSQLPGASSQPPPPTFDPKIGLPPTPQVSQPVTAPAVSPDISNYIAQQKTAQNQYGPQQQQDVINHILQSQRSPGSVIGQGLAGLGDAISTGVGRSANPGFLNALQNRQGQQAQLQVQGLQNARGANVENLAANQKLDAMDPQSPLSASKRAQNGPILEAMGFDPSTIGKMSAAEMDTTLGILKDFRGKELETAVARYKAQIEANQLQETSRHNKAEEGAKGTELAQTAAQQEAANALKGEEIGAGEVEHAASEPLTSRLAGLVGLNPAGKALQQQALGNAPLAAQPSQDAQAIAWAQAHPNDPRAIKIKSIHGIP